MRKYVLILVLVLGLIAISGCSQQAKTLTGNVVETTQNTADVNQESVTDVKEFTMTSFYNETGKWFSLKEIDVKKGDMVRIKVTNIKGSHDFSLDEYGIKEMTPLNQEVVIEFTADKVGDFIYYCSVPGHRAGGQWGTLRVTE